MMSSNHSTVVEVLYNDASTIRGELMQTNINQALRALNIRAAFKQTLILIAVNKCNTLLVS